MPANDHLQWNDIHDFSPGLWTAGSYLMPPNAAQEMRDCHPMPGGGLRAFYRRQTLASDTKPTNVGLTTADEVYIGAFAHPAGGINPNSDRYLLAWDSDTLAPKLLYSDGGDWVLKKTFAVTSSAPTLSQSFFTTYLSGTTRRVVFNLNVGSADDGIWIVTGAGTPTQMTVTGATAESGPICVHQSRIVVTDGNGVRFTNPGTETFASGNFIAVEPSGLRPNVVFLASYEPSDLLVGKEAGPLVLVQGDLADPTVQAMDDTTAVVASQVPSKSPLGLAFTSHRDGVFASHGGGSTQKLSKSLSPDNFGLPAVFGSYTPGWIGNVLYSEGFLFTPSAILDVATGAWFTSGAPVGNTLAPLYVYDRGTA